MPVYNGETMYVEDSEMYDQFTTESQADTEAAETETATPTVGNSTVPIVETEMTEIDYTKALAVPDAEPFISAGLAEAPVGNPDGGDAAVPAVFALEVFANAEHHPLLWLAQAPESHIFFAADGELTSYILVGARNRSVLTESASQCETIKRVLPGTCSPLEAIQSLPGTTGPNSASLSLTDTVTITDGPFQDSLALVDGFDRSRDEAQVILEGGMHNLPVTLPVAHLERAQSTLQL